MSQSTTKIKLPEVETLMLLNVFKDNVIEKVRADNTRKDQQNIELKNLNDTLRKELDKTIKERESLERERTQLYKKIQEKNTILENFQKQIIKLTSEKQNMATQIAELQKPRKLIIRQKE